MEIKITTLSENSAGLGSLAEWGLSMLVEADSMKVLFDTGASISAVHNAQLLGRVLGRRLRSSARSGVAAGSLPFL